MQIQKNTANLWDSVWDKPSTAEKDLYTVAKEERLIRWQRMEAMVLERFGGFEGLSAIEIGAGRGTNAALMAQRGANVTVLDYSDGALEGATTDVYRSENPARLSTPATAMHLFCGEPRNRARFRTCSPCQAHIDRNELAVGEYLQP